MHALADVSETPIAFNVRDVRGLARHVSNQAASYMPAEPPWLKYRSAGHEISELAPLTAPEKIREEKIVIPQPHVLPEHQFVNANEEHEVAYWTKAFGVTRRELEAAVIAVGVRVEDVRAKLGKQPCRSTLAYLFIKGSYE